MGKGKLFNRYKNYLYDGNWSKDIPNGDGYEEWNNGKTSYKGQFKEGIKEGYGKYI